MKIYTITNLINGKKYVGQTIQKNPRERWHRHCSPHPIETAIHKAIEKYGKDNFEFKIVDEAHSIDELNRKEVVWIKSLDTYRNGYNRDIGGNNRAMSVETRKKISKKMQGKLHRTKGLRAVVCINNGKEFCSQMEAVRFFGLGRNDVYHSIKKNVAVKGGLKFKNKESL